MLCEASRARVPTAWAVLCLLFLGVVGCSVDRPFVAVRHVPALRWPDGNNTGVPAGTHLRPSGSLVVSQPGTFVRGLDIAGCVVVLAANVTIEQTRITGSCVNLVENHSIGLVVRRTELIGVGQAANGQAIGYDHYQAVAVNIHGTGDGLRANGDVLIQDSWIHDLQECAQCHNDGVQISQGRGIVVRHNRIENSLAQTSALLVKADQGDISGLDIADNILDGGGYTVYLLNARYVVTNVRFRGNAFGRSYHLRGGRYGPVDVAVSPTSVVQWDSNIWLGTGDRVLLPGLRS